MAKKKEFNDFEIKLEEHLLIQVDGIDQKSHTISWDILKNLCDTTQNLIEKLVRYSEDEYPIDSKSIKIVFAGFHQGSAVPELKVEPRDSLFPIDSAIKSLNRDFSDVLKNINSGNFESIAQKYTVPKERNEIVEAVFNFTNSSNGAPMNVVERAGGKKTFKKLAKVVSMRKEQKLALIIPINPIENTQVTKEEEVGIVIKSISKTGRKSTRIKQTYKRNEASLVYTFDSIEFDEKIYLFNYPIHFDFSTIEKNKPFTIENKALDIYAYGTTDEEAHEDLFYQFASTYDRLNELDNKQLSEHLRRVKAQYNLIVHSVTNINK
jgi:hypothetical protein